MDARHCHFLRQSHQWDAGRNRSDNARYSLMTMKMAVIYLIALLNQIYRIADDAYLVILRSKRFQLHCLYPLFQRADGIAKLIDWRKTLLNVN